MFLSFLFTSLLSSNFDGCLVNFMASSACNSDAQSDKEIQEANDELLAKVLQQQLDEEDNKQIKLEEKKYNGNNKGCMSFIISSISKMYILLTELNVCFVISSLLFFHLYGSLNIKTSF